MFMLECSLHINDLSQLFCSILCALATSKLIFPIIDASWLHTSSDMYDSSFHALTSSNCARYNFFLSFFFLETSCSFISQATIQCAKALATLNAKSHLSMIERRVCAFPLRSFRVKHLTWIALYLTAHDFDSEGVGYVTKLEAFELDALTLSITSY